MNTINKKIVIAVIGLIVLLTILLFSLKIFKNKDRYTDRSGIIVDTEKIVDTSFYSIEQEISINEPYQVDSFKPIFIIPIGQINYRNKKYNVSESGLNFTESSYDKAYEYSNFHGLFNNFVLIDYSRNIKTTIFKQKVALTEWAILKINNERLILFKGINKDNNKDGVLNEDDFQSLFVYNLNSMLLKEFSFKNQTVLEFKPLKLTSKVYVRTGKDLNNDNKYNYNSEPKDLYIYDAETGESEVLVPQNIKTEIHNILNK